MTRLDRSIARTRFFLPVLISVNGGGSLLTVLALVLLLDAPGCQDPLESHTFSMGKASVQVVYYGEVSNEDLFGEHRTLDIRPLDNIGRPTGMYIEPEPTWLHFQYSLDGHTRRIFVAKRPLMNFVSWDAIARAGAALGDGSEIQVGGRRFIQNATVMAADGRQFRIRLPTCGRSTFAHVSEWNLLIGAIHERDIDFNTDNYGWVRSPYSDEDLLVGLHGSLTWCQEAWKDGGQHRVARGYFLVSRFHAAPRYLATDRLMWRPVLEEVQGSIPLVPETAMPCCLRSAPTDSIQDTLKRNVRYLGIVPHELLFDPDQRLADVVGVYGGIVARGSSPEWLVFEYGGRVILVAARPTKYAISWDAIARAGAVLGDGSAILIDGVEYPQAASVTDRHGRRYAVRLLSCGTSTMDSLAEWNLLIGAVHVGDGDFKPPRYGWIDSPLKDVALGVGERQGGATWCQDTQQIQGQRYAVNRGYLTVSRFHMTPSEFDGSGFGWRPVLELSFPHGPFLELLNRPQTKTVTGDALMRN